MTRSISGTNLTALGKGMIMPRDYLWIVARSRVDQSPQAVGFWSDVGNVNHTVVNPDTGASAARDFYGSATLIEISAIPQTANLQVQQVSIKMSQINDLVEQAVRTYDCKQARVEIYRGLLNTSTGALIDPAMCRFVGFVDQIEIQTPAEGEEGAVVFTCTSHTQELLRSNPDTRSHQSQIVRHAGDNFFKDAGVVSDWTISWGENEGSPETVKKKKGLFGWGNFLGFL